jgi:hypothetical protein
MFAQILAKHYCLSWLEDKWDTATNFILRMRTVQWSITVGNDRPMKIFAYRSEQNKEVEATVCHGESMFAAFALVYRAAVCNRQRFIHQWTAYR